MNRALFRKIAVMLVFFAAGAAAFACEMAFRLEGQEYSTVEIHPGSAIKLVKGQSYKLTVEFIEDHRNCRVPACDTYFLLDNEKWKLKKESQGLIIKSMTEWDEKTQTKNSMVIEFTASVQGVHELQIVRDCPKGGYNEKISFSVE